MMPSSPKTQALPARLKPESRGLLQLVGLRLRAALDALAPLRDDADVRGVEHTLVRTTELLARVVACAELDDGSAGWTAT
jgi:hypothetical protein